MTWPTDTLSNANIDQGTDKPHLARPDLNALMLMVQSILGEAPAGSLMLTNQDEGAGNGLDADTVDGEHASAFADAGHVHSADTDITSGTLAVSRGGTDRGFLTAYSLILGNGTAQVNLLSPSATAGHVLTSNGASANPTYKVLPTFPTVDVHASDFWDGEIQATSSSGSFNETIATGLGSSDISWGISGIRRTDAATPDTLDANTGYAIDGAGFSIPIGNSNVIVSSSSAPAAGSIKVVFNHSSGGNISFRVRLWARKNINP